MKTKIYIFALLMAISLSARAAVYPFGTLASGSPLGPILDNNKLGLTESYTVSGEGASLSALTLMFDLQGGSATDLSGYLRLGTTESSPYYDLTTLIHEQTLSAGSPTSFSIDFSTVGFQTAFSGQNSNDKWTLFFADTVNGDQTTLNGWSLNMETSPVPEPVNVALGIFGGVLGLVALRQKFGKQARLCLASARLEADISPKQN